MSGPGGGLLVAGTTSDVGKSMVTAGICRWLARNGVRVAPFKAQNMSNNSSVVVGADGRGGEIGRAQAMQARACGTTPDVRFNPVLLKPGRDRSSQVVLLGEAVTTATVSDYRALQPRLARAAFGALAELRSEYDVVVCEGAGSVTEVNLRSGDFVNMGLARHAGFPVVVVGDADRGGVAATLFGALALLEPADQRLVSGFVVNKFRSDLSLLRPGLAGLSALTGRPVHGILPFSTEVWLDAEDLHAYGRVLGRPGPPHGTEWLRVVVIGVPHMSNVTDAEALAAEPGVRVRFGLEPADLLDADLVVLPGSKATVDDLGWLRRAGLAGMVARHAAAGRPVLGICGGFQMLAESVRDDVESRCGSVPGLGLLPVRIAFAERKKLALSSGTALGARVHGYEIHHGAVVAGDPEPLLVDAAGRGEGAVAANVYGTHWHGLFESDEFRRRFLTVVARQAGRAGFRPAPDTCFAAIRERALDILGDLVEQHLDTAALRHLIEAGPAPELPFVPPGAPAAVPFP
ncbi:cobyric acid synthase [Symbioplanes lichenis]|uniref:cobyric acid synthase n=1 Tax=Symbioplanes lichenis TaxID=1629072 RepID=UPI00273968C0|nr:cobyric acid synthase [Actinoplanes lichenis]